MACKKRKYESTYLQFGFSSIIVNGEEKPQCLVCLKILSNDSMKSCKLKQHFKTHPQYSDKRVDFFERSARSVRTMKMDKTGSIFTTNSKTVEASYVVALEIAKQKKPHTVGETLVKPCAMKMVEIVLGNGLEKKLVAVSLSDNTVQRRISDMSVNVKNQVVSEIKAAKFGLLSIQLDESTDVSSCAQLLVFVRYVFDNVIKEEFLFCSPLETTTKGSDILAKVTSFFDSNGISWDTVCGSCTDGAPAMLGNKSGFQASVKKLNSKIKVTHCMIHRQAPASKTLPNSLGVVLKQIIKIVNFVKSSALNSRLFKQLGANMDSNHQMLLYHTNVRWLSKGNVTDRFFELRAEVKSFLELQNKNELLAVIKNPHWIMQLAYLADIFEQLNKLNLKLQGSQTTIIQFIDSLNAFLGKLQNWKRKVQLNNFAMFERLSSVIDNCTNDKTVPKTIKNEITEHLTSLLVEFKTYFPDIKAQDLDLVRNPFRIAVTKVPDRFQDELIDLQNDSKSKELFEETSQCDFWATMSGPFPNIAERALRVLLPFVSTYLCETGFSAMLQMKTKYRNRLDIEDDMRCALSKTAPRIKMLAENVQAQVSH
ncbi:zinc finger BED domain-containing protein 5-like [Wyeomyia smithii]|uniref:zinc finger BED domain-containing protein 5-like n=1 Tax=Wyeomyia smithii TaxID=174621 RepID=UPI002467C0EA|nr:zinc finger BED domain-containing protein 5-like [Wyeomyia smithii]